NKEASTILGRARIGMLVLRSGRTPLVNPAAFSYTSGALWMTTSRFAAKTVLARRDPRAAFFVDGGARAVVLRGTMEVFDPISLTSQVRALLGGPGFHLGMAGYTLKTAPFVAGSMRALVRTTPTGRRLWWGCVCADGSSARWAVRRSPSATASDSATCHRRASFGPSA